MLYTSSDHARASRFELFAERGENNRVSAGVFKLTIICPYFAARSIRHVRCALLLCCFLCERGIKKYSDQIKFQLRLHKDGTAIPVDA